MLGSEEMGTKTLISEQEYLTTSYLDRTPEYVEGEIVERSLPNHTHSEIQVELIYRFRGLSERFPIHTRSELRLRVAPQRYRIVDVAVFYKEKPTGLLPTQIPHLIVEIVSPDDRHEDIMTRLEEYTAFGVPHVWLVDPGLASLHVYKDASLIRVPAFELPEFSLRLSAEEILG
jgi:Uma2 family endonuclease